MARGIVKWFNNEKGYGFITVDGGEDVFVHFSAIESETGYTPLDQGQRVELEVAQGERGLQAERVRVAVGHGSEEIVDPGKRGSQLRDFEPGRPGSAPKHEPATDDPEREREDLRVRMSRAVDPYNDARGIMATAGHLVVALGDPLAFGGHTPEDYIRADIYLDVDDTEVARKVIHALVSRDSVAVTLSCSRRAS